jgi:hypothetical protein
LKWPIIGVLIVFFAFGAYLLSRKAVVTVPVGSTEPSASSPHFARAAAPNSDGQPPSLADVDAAVGSSLDSLKERIFRLELRRQAGTITEEEYAQERARTEKVLRDLVRG